MKALVQRVSILNRSSKKSLRLTWLQRMRHQRQQLYQICSKCQNRAQIRAVDRKRSPSNQLQMKSSSHKMDRQVNLLCPRSPRIELKRCKVKVTKIYSLKYQRNSRSPRHIQALIKLSCIKQARKESKLLLNLRQTFHLSLKW